MLQPCHGVVAVSSENKEITEHDVFRVREAAELITIPSDREIIDVVPIHYKVDELDEINDPRGMIRCSVGNERDFNHRSTDNFT